MIKQIEDIVRDVRIAIDENATSKALFAEGDTETLTLDEIIKGSFVYFIGLPLLSLRSV